MIPVVVAIALVAVCVLGVLAWRWLELVEKVKVEREKAGGKELVQAVALLTGRVDELEKYMKGQ